MEGWLSGQKQWTVNPSVNTYAGSNPAPSKLISLFLYKEIFCL